MATCRTAEVAKCNSQVNGRCNLRAQLHSNGLEFVQSMGLLTSLYINIVWEVYSFDLPVSPKEGLNNVAHNQTKQF